MNEFINRQSSSGTTTAGSLCVCRQQILVGFHGKEGGGVGECLTKYPLPYAGFRKQT